MNGIAQPLDLMGEIDALEVLAEGLEHLTPSGCVSSDERTMTFPLAETGGLCEIDLAPQARAGVAAGIAHQRPADGLRSLAVVLEVLLRHVRVVPFQLRVERSRRRLEFQAERHGTHDPLQGLKSGACPQPLEGIRPARTVSQVYRVVIAVGVTKT